MDIKVSVVVPAYNCEKYIEDTVKMLISQTLRDIEIIIVDDGSTDSTPQLCDKLSEQDSRIRVAHIKNGGVCKARNTGISLARGEYIGFSDSDDILEPALYETLYNTAIENACDVSMVKYATVFPDGKVINDTGTDEVRVYTSKTDVLADFLQNKLYSGVYTKLFKRELCSKISFEEGRKINEDKKYIFDALRYAESWCYKDSRLYTYIRRDGSSSNSGFAPKMFDCIYFADKINEIVLRDFPQLEDYSRAYSINSYLYVVKVMCLFDSEKDYPDRYKEISEFLKSFRSSFCKKYLTRNDYIKWYSLKINKGLFKLLVKKFGRT